MIRFGEFEFDIAANELSRDGCTVHLREQCLKLLGILLASRGEIVTRDQLRSRLWPNGTIVDFEHSVNAAMKSLREALGDSVDDPHFIQTVPKRGYRFIADVSSCPTPDGRHTECEQGESARKRPELPECFSHYRLQAQIGAGAMGRVYRAHDTLLGRDVAVKVLPSELRADADRLARFQFEARATAALNSPNIVAVYDLGEIAGVMYLVTELLDGRTLRAVLEQQRLSLPVALRYALQILQGLATAHDKGIIHRDLKPENIFITNQGTLKLLDFGVAKLTRSLPGGAEKPLLPIVDTMPGAILGSVGYMAPEQVRGEAADQRSDLFAFGAILYEMLAGQRAFHAGSPVETLSAILQKQPQPLCELNDLVSNTLQAVVDHCLQKDLETRSQSARDVLFELQAFGDVQLPGVTAPHIWARHRLFWSTVVLVALLLGSGSTWFLAKEKTHPLNSVGPMQFALILPDDAPLAAPGGVSPGHDRPALDMSRDGSHLAYVAQRGNKTQICVRDMASSETTCLPGTEGASTPFFSPDGKSMGFIAASKLKTISYDGGSVTTLTDGPSPWGAVWGENGYIYFNRSEGEGVSRIKSEGGPIEPVANANGFMPEYVRNDAILVTSFDSLIFVDSSGRQKRVLTTTGLRPRARLVAHKHLLYSESGRLLTVPFDSAQGEITGKPVVIADGVRSAPYGVAQYTFAQDGTVIYAPGQPQTKGRLMRVDRTGARHPLELPEQDYFSWALSPDGSRIAYSTEGELWIYDFASSKSLRLAGRVAKGKSYYNAYPRWAPDSRNLAYWRWDGSGYQLVWSAADGGGSVELWSSKSTGPEWLYPAGFSPDGRVMSVFGLSKNSGLDLYLLHFRAADGSLISAEPELFLGGTSTEALGQITEAFGQISPDGRWMLFTSNLSDNYEIFVTSFPKPSQLFQVSTNGGREAMWNPKRPEIVYISGMQMYAVDVTLGEQFRAGKPRLLFEGAFPDMPGLGFDIAPDGSHFVMLENEKVLGPTKTLKVITNFGESSRP